MTNSSSPSASHGFNQVAVIGAGTMGRGIAMSFLNAGISVTLVDVGQEALDQGVAAIHQTYEQMMAKERIDQAGMEQRLAQLRTATDYSEIREVDLAIEAVYENLALKQKIFSQLDTSLKADAVLATNTSYLDVDAIANATQRPQQVLGLHFFSPAHIMKLLEIVRGAKTAPEVLARAQTLAKQIKKVAVVAGNCHGFIGNRMLAPYVHQARMLLLEGALPQQVDRALESFGMAMGPFRMYDVVGVDLEWRARQMAGTPSDISVWLDDRLCEMGRFGQKSGQGYYRYETGSRTAIPDPQVEALVAKASEAAGIERRDISDDTIVTRCILALINEGAKILDEGIAGSSADIDTVYLNGYGFPAERGGPMAYADSLGLQQVLAEIQALQRQHGDVWQPAALLQRLAEQNGRFADYRTS